MQGQSKKTEDRTDAMPHGAGSSPYKGDSSPDESGLDSGLSSLSLLCPSDEQKSLLLAYTMSHARPGKAVVICNTTFHPSLNLPQRKGIEQDINRIQETFRDRLGFEFQLLREQTAAQMYQAMSLESRADHTNDDCLAVFVLSHGRDQGMLYGVDTVIPVDKFVEPLKTCQTLLNKPKMIFVQSCRGDKWDHGMSADADDDKPKEEVKITIPVEADFLYAYSTADGYVSFNNPKNGSWFIQALCAEFGENSDKLEVLQMLTRVCHKLAYEYASHTPSRPDTHNLKQVSSITTTLTKALHLRRKQ